MYYKAKYYERSMVEFFFFFLLSNCASLEAQQFKCLTNNYILENTLEIGFLIFTWDMGKALPPCSACHPAPEVL